MNDSDAIVPILQGGMGKEMLREAVAHIKSLQGTAAQKVDLFEKLSNQIAKRTDSSWTARRGVGSDGSHIFTGRQGDLLIINPQGRLFRGSALRGGVIIIGGDITPRYEALTEIQEHANQNRDSRIAPTGRSYKITPLRQ